MERKDLTASVYTFEKLRTADYLYIDKTEYIWNLIRREGGMYFLSRPRRFGKSLTVSTLKAIFQGKKEIFKGLNIYDKPYDWKPYPVIHLSFGNYNTRGNALADFPDYLMARLRVIADEFNIVMQEHTPGDCFNELISILGKTAPVVILIDEYDKPILDNITNPDLPEIMKILKGFYSTIKDCNALERFVFITGVSKFCHVSLFSDLNNLQDISMNADYATMLGYTQAEFEQNFADWIAYAEAKQDSPHDKYLAQIKSWYDGYRFEETAESVYNPVSLANFFINGGKFRNYWFTTGTPTFLFELMKKSNFNLPVELNTPISADLFNSFEIDRIEPMMLFYQTGYITIAEYRRKKMEYVDEYVTEYLLKFPNREVEDSFNKSLLSNYAGVWEKDSLRLIQDLIHSVGSGDVPMFIKLLKGIFAGIPYDIHVKNEHYYQTIIYVIFDMLRFYITAEHRTNDGRADLTLETGDWIYVVELKMDLSADTAVKQIENKDYALKFRNRGKRIMTIGINFDSERGQITDWQQEEIID